MRSIDEWFNSYNADHQNSANRLIHWFCVPAILWSVIALLWIVPVPAQIGRAGFWCGLVMVGAVSFYWRLSRPLTAAMLIVFVLFGVVTEYLYRVLGARQLLVLAGGVFVVAWLGQFIGHRIERRRPSFLTDLAYLMIGPAWLVAKIMRRLGIGY